MATIRPTTGATQNLTVRKVTHHSPDLRLFIRYQHYEGNRTGTLGSGRPEQVAVGSLLRLSIDRPVMLAQDGVMTGPAERCWMFDTLAVTLAQVDFLDPALAGSPGARERGVRVEIRPMTQDFCGSVYASPAMSLAPAVCRIDLLESAPGAADRMHWHPVMTQGEPGDRTFDPAMPQDPAAWLAARLREVDALLQRSGMPDVERHRGAVASIRESAEEIVDAARDGLAWASEPWLAVRHDERGMALRGA